MLGAVHKLVSAIINRRMAERIMFCDAMHGFRRKRGCFTAIGKVKLRMQRAACAGKTLYQVFLDLRKAYDSIHREGVLALLEKYKVGRRIRTYIKNVWDNQVFILRQKGFYSKAISVERGVTQGDIDSPIIFNLIIDAVLRKLREGEDFGRSDLSFYADDSLLENENLEDLQKDLDKGTELFGKFGLKPNDLKTKFMVIRGARVAEAQEQTLYNKRRKGGKQTRNGER